MPSNIKFINLGVSSPLVVSSTAPENRDVLWLGELTGGTRDIRFYDGNSWVSITASLQGSSFRNVSAAAAKSLLPSVDFLNTVIRDHLTISDDGTPINYYANQLREDIVSLINTSIMDAGGVGGGSSTITLQQIDQRLRTRFDGLEGEPQAKYQIDGANIRDRTITGVKIGVGEILGGNIGSQQVFGPEDSLNGRAFNHRQIAANTVEGVGRIITTIAEPRYVRGNIKKGTIVGYNPRFGEEGDIKERSIRGSAGGTNDIGDIALASIGTPDLADGAVTTPKIGEGAVTTPNIGEGQVRGRNDINIPNNHGNQREIATGSIRGTHPASALSAGDIAQGSIYGSHRDGIQRDIAHGSIRGTRIDNRPGPTNGNYIQGDIAWGSIRGYHETGNQQGDIVPGSIRGHNVTRDETGDIAPASIQTQDLADGAVTNAKLADVREVNFRIGTGSGSDTVLDGGRNTYLEISFETIDNVIQTSGVLFVAEFYLQANQSANENNVDTIVGTYTKITGVRPMFIGSAYTVGSNTVHRNTANTRDTRLGRRELEVFTNNATNVLAFSDTVGELNERSILSWTSMAIHGYVKVIHGADRVQKIRIRGTQATRVENTLLNIYEYNFNSDSRHIWSRTITNSIFAV